MYRNFFGLERYPFEVSPDPSFLYTTGQHQEAIAGLYYGVTARKGFMVLTGEVGTGKTLVVRCFLELLDQAAFDYAYVFNSCLSSEEFLRYVADDLGVRCGPTKSDLLLEFSRHLIERNRQGRTAVLVVDEAQHLDNQVLEEVRLLTNLETPRGKLLQIILAGQPELQSRLESPELRQLKQRVTLRFRLRPFSRQETTAYVWRRLELAGDGQRPIFTRQALDRVFAFSAGIPRLINTLCDNAMLSAFSLGKFPVGAEQVEEAASDLQLSAGAVPAETPEEPPAEGAGAPPSGDETAAPGSEPPAASTGTPLLSSGAPPPARPRRQRNRRWRQTVGPEVQQGGQTQP